jgi:uncharacterized membrane protein
MTQSNEKPIRVIRKKLNKLINMMERQQEQLDRLERNQLEQQQQQQQQQQMIQHVVYSAEESIPKPQRVMPSGNRRAKPITRPLVINTIKRHLLSDVTAPFTTRMMAKKRSELQRKGHNKDDTYIKAALVYDMVRGFTTKVCKDTINAMETVSYSTLSANTKGELQQALNDQAAVYGVHIGKAETDWMANHFVGKHFSHISDSNRKKEKKVNVYTVLSLTFLLTFFFFLLLLFFLFCFCVVFWCMTAMWIITHFFFLV